ncbi:MAG: V-type ATP synthase subunit C [Clostridiales bacterium]
MKDSTKYTYAVSRIRAIEKNMIDKNFFDRIIESKTIKNVIGLLEEIEYGNIHENKSDDFDFEYMLEDESKKLKQLINEVTPGDDFIKTIFHINDYHNAKVVLKGLSGIEYDDLLIDIGQISPEELKTIILEKELSFLPKNLKECIDICLNNSSILNDPKSIDITMDKAYLEELFESALKTKNTYILNLVKMLIDIYNIKGWIRIKKRDKNSWDLLNKILVDKGKIDKKTYMNYMEKELDESLDYFKYTDYGNLMTQSIEQFNENGNLTQLEKLCDDYVVNYLKNSKVITFGIEPIISYIMAKQIEMKNLRIIITGKINNIPNDTIKERLRECYV